MFNTYYNVIHDKYIMLYKQETGLVTIASIIIW